LDQMSIITELTHLRFKYLIVQGIFHFQCPQLEEFFRSFLKDGT